jgi:hypothetical protein
MRFISIDKANEPIYVRQVEPDEITEVQCRIDAIDILTWLEDHAPSETLRALKHLIKTGA